MISVSDLSKSYGARTLFRDVSFQLNPGERYGLIGANGSGKTTLLNILSGELEPSHGSVSIPKRISLGVLRQDQFLHEEHDVIHVAMMGDPELWRAMVEKDALLERDDAEFDVERFSELEETIQRLDGYSAEARAAEILEGLGLEAETHHQPLATLSGGFKLRVLLAQVLAAAPDVLLLDEPTNHLDILSIRWLEKFLRDFAGPVVVISHDHRFLDNVATHILDVDYETVTLYAGNYSRFHEAKVLERERREKEIGEREREIAHHQQFVDRFRAKASKARQAQSKLRLIEKKADQLVPLAPSSRRYPNFRFAERRHSGREVLQVRGVSKSFGDNRVLEEVDLTVSRGDRLAIMGPNGIGKSTLLKIIMGELPPDSGTVEWGYETYPGYFAQDHHDQFEDETRTAEEWISLACDRPSVGFVRGELGRVLFSGEEAEKRLGDLSGGEAARLVFCRLAIQKPNVLVLDEPTNHLDLESIEALVEAFLEFPGTLVLVSHDRWFVSQLATRIVEISREGIRDFVGSYEQFVHATGDDHLDVDTVVLKAQEEKRKSRQNKAGSTAADDEDVRQLERLRDAVTSSIDELESRLVAIDARFVEPGFYDATSREQVAGLEQERRALQEQLESRLAEWESLEAELEAAR